jgi:hypothetical protein
MFMVYEVVLDNGCSEYPSDSADTMFLANRLRDGPVGDF